ncbi:MAG: magnesium/cobalt transporter CorA [Gammaproteobacteria bacterium]
MRVMLLNPATGTLEVDTLPLSERLSRPRPPGVWLWIDLDNESAEAERELLTGQLGIHRLAVQDAQRDRHPPKVETFDASTFLLLKGLTADTTDIDFDTLQIALFFCPDFLVTRRVEESVSIDGAWQDVITDGKATGLRPADVVYRISRRITDRFHNILMALELRLETLEQNMYEHPSDDLLSELMETSSRLKKLRRHLTYQQNLMQRLAQPGVPGIPPDTRHEFTDLFENTERLVSLSALYQELINDLISGYISVSSHRLNQVMKVLTIVTVLFLPLGLIVGLYGMNFEYMPELRFRYGYFIVLGLMATVVTVLLLVFRHKRWL